ncbi:hypothetical protein FRC09_018985 [Ceratobasidium sp. 395]|nr:hypothetical protein FRC09_018985 [Ceratobasidium sp. 395]
MDITCHAPDNWKACRSVLATAIQSYLAACADLHLTCSQTQRPYKTRREVEPVLLAVDAELDGLASEEEELGKSRVSLSVLRNRSSALAPVHSLPPEVLAHIFLMAQCRSDGPVSDHAFARVSTYWRTTAISLPTLWTQITITLAQVNYEYATLSLGRSGSLPIYLDISSKEDITKWDNQSKTQWKAFLANAIEKAHTLNIVDLCISQTFLDETIRLLLRHGSPGVLKALCIKRTRCEDYADLGGFPATQFDPILRSITVLHLSDTLLPWTSTAYHSLVDLRLQFTENDKREISTSQLAGILAASPGLTILKFDDITITSSDDWDAENVVRLAHLEVLCLWFLSYRSWVALISVLSLSDCLGSLEVGIRAQDSVPHFSKISHLVQDFLHGARIKTLAIIGFEDDDPHCALSLSATIPSLQSLVLSDCDLLQSRGDEATGDEPNINVDTPSRLPHLFLASSKFSLDNLKRIVSVSGVETLHLDRVPTRCGHNGPTKDELRAALLDAFPRLTCVITDKDTTLKWPCRTFNW